MGQLRIAVASALLVSGCSHQLLTVEPRRRAGQDTLYANGTPILVSHGSACDVAMQPKASPTGRYPMGEQVMLMVAVYNHSGHRIEVSEASFTARANGFPIRNIPATEIEDDVNSSAAWAQAFNSFSGAVSSMGAGLANDNRFAARMEQRQVNAETVAKTQAIEERRIVGINQLNTVLQRNTIEPAHGVAGALVFEVRRRMDCAQLTAAAEPARDGLPARPAQYAPGPCRLTITADVAGEAHSFEWVERLGR